MRLTTTEAFVRALQAHGIRDAFGIIGSVFMPISDLLPRAGGGADHGGADGALREAVRAQMEDGTTTLVEAMINQELGEPFRRDAMRKPVAVAGIHAADMA